MVVQSNYFSSCFTIDLGSMKPANINQIKPGNLVNGISAINFGNIKLKQLASPKNAISKPKTTSHLGKSFINPAETATPAIKRPNGTE
jgi:hypothetical protein